MSYISSSPFEVATTTSLPLGLKAHASVASSGNIRVRVPALVSQMIRVSSSPVDAMWRPSGLKTQALTGLKCPCNVSRTFPLSVDQYFREWSFPSDKTDLRSALQAQARPRLVKVRSSEPVATSQSLTTSRPADSTVVPS